MVTSISQNHKAPRFRDLFVGEQDKKKSYGKLMKRISSNLCERYE
jgi:hypothetical protein